MTGSHNASYVQSGLAALREIDETREGKIVNPNEAAALLAEIEQLRDALESANEPTPKHSRGCHCGRCE